jgi:hypothetical protein
MALKLHIGAETQTVRFRDRAAPPPLRRLVFRDTDFLTVERLGPMQSLTPEGFLVIRNVPLARTGPQLYSDQEIPIQGDAGGRIVIDRDPEEVFRPSTLSSLNGKAVTLDHPDDDVTPENFKALLVGTVINPRRGERVLDNLLLGDLIIYDPAAIKAIRDGDVREVSVGYKADYEETGIGRGRQRNIVCNHLALVQDGRCGPTCRIGDKAYFPTHDEGCGCSQCGTQDEEETQGIPPLHAKRDRPQEPPLEPEPSEFLDEFKEAEHPREESGRFTEGGGEKTAGGGETTKAKGSHPGRGYSQEAELRDGVIHTTNVNDAVRALYEDRKVALDQPHQVSTLVSKLSDVAKRMERLGGKAPNFDLCNVSIAGTNLFCAENKGIPRAKMPQIPRDDVPAFREFLQKQGFSSEDDEVPVAHLRATQDELVGAKVSSMMKWMRDRDPADDAPLMISRDDYVMDGHHRWAARVGLDAGGDFGKTKIKVSRVDIGIIDLLAQAEAFTGGKGKKEARAEARDAALIHQRRTGRRIHVHIT